MNFESRFTAASRRHDRMRKVVTAIIALIALIVFAMIGTGFYLVFQFVEVIQTEGLKGVIDTIWNGANALQN